MTSELPKLRHVDVRPVNHQGMPMIVLNDPLRLRRAALLVPQMAGPLLALMDGTRDLAALQEGFLHHTGVRIDPEEVEALISGLDDGFLLDNQRFRQAKAAAMNVYRTGPFRPPSIAGSGYPADPWELKRALDSYCRDAATVETGAADNVVAAISPHIDYARGWRTYAHTWTRLKRAVQEAELIILLGTDHAGNPGSITLTRQSYATPWGILPTDIALVDQMAGVLGEDAAFAAEQYHLGEHSIELASVWLHYAAEGQPKRVLPVLCGQHTPLLLGGATASRAWEAIDLLAKAAAKQRTLVVAAGDLSHVGPAFGDKAPLDEAAKAGIQAFDDRYLKVACTGQPEAMTDYALIHGDPTRICGSAPIHFLSRIVPGSAGSVVDYQQCAADDTFGSLVSIAGVSFRK
ncbi:MAG: hypothetical protein HW397_285 [Dehalococcoidia bacterium]|nr:hypothetical protein [Dehalococcoidia bacterium]